MLTFQQFWTINEKVSVGSYPMALYKGKNGYHIGVGDEQPDIKVFLKKEQLPTYLQAPGLAAMYALGYTPDARTDALHLYRFKKHSSPISTSLSWNAVIRTVGLIKQKIQEQSKLGTVKIAHPASSSVFNDLVKKELQKQLPNIPIIELPKKILSELPAKELLPFENLQRKNPKITDRVAKLTQYIHLLYDDYLKNHPEAVDFSRDTLSRELNEYNKLVGGKINQKKVLNPKEMADFRENGFKRISDIIKDTAATVFHSKEEIQPGDRIIVFDDNTSTGFTETQIKRALGSNVMVPYVIYGLKILEPA
jgi:hypothetical protein